MATVKLFLPVRDRDTAFRYQDNENHGNKELMAAVTGALWKLSMSEDNVKCFQVHCTLHTAHCTPHTAQ